MEGAAGSRPRVLDDWYRFPTYNRFFTPTPQKIFEESSLQHWFINFTTKYFFFFSLVFRMVEAEEEYVEQECMSDMIRCQMQINLNFRVGGYCCSSLEYSWWITKKSIFKDHPSSFRSSLLSSSSKSSSPAFSDHSKWLPLQKIHLAPMKILTPFSSIQRQSFFSIKFSLRYLISTTYDNDFDIFLYFFCTNSQRFLMTKNVY